MAHDEHFNMIISYLHSIVEYWSTRMKMTCVYGTEIRPTTSLLNQHAFSVYWLTVTVVLRFKLCPASFIVTL